MSLKTTLETIKEEFASLMIDAEKFETKGNKAAGTRARKKASNLAKSLKELRAEIQAVKNEE